MQMIHNPPWMGKIDSATGSEKVLLKINLKETKYLEINEDDDRN